MKLVEPTARRTNVLYVAPDSREAKLARGAFDKSHPHLTLEFTNDINDARRHLKENGGCDALLIGWSVAEPDALALIAHVRQQALPMAVIAAGEQALERYAQAGADECVARGASFLARLPDAIDGAVAKREAAVARAANPEPAAPRPLQVAYAGDLQFLRGALGADRAQLHATPLAQAMADAVAGRATIDVVVLDTGARDPDTAATLAEVRRQPLAAPVVLLVDPADETTALRTFNGTIDECLVKTPGWTARLLLRLGAVRARFDQARELETLRAREARLRALVDRLPACVVRLSADGAVLAMNPVALDLVGATEPRQILRKPFQALVGALDIDACTEFVRRIAEGEQRSMEFALTTLTGVSRTIAATGVPVAPEDGRPGSVLMVMRDVTDRKRLEQALEEAPDAEPAPSAAEPVTPATSLPLVVEHSQAVSVTIAQPEEFFASAKPIEWPEDVPQPAAEAPAREVRSGEVDPAQLRDMEAALTRLCGQARVTFQELEDALHAAEAQHDATLAQQQEAAAQLDAALRERWQSYDAFVSDAQLGIIQIDGHGTIVEANRAFAGALGYASPAELVAAAAAAPPLTEAAPWAAAVEAWRTGASPAAVDTRWRRTDGSLVMLRLTGQMRRPSDGQDPRIELVAENLTALRALESQVRRARKWEDVARLTSGLAADLRGVVDDMSGTARHDVAALESAMTRAADLSRQLVAFGRRGVRAPEPLDVNAVVRGVEDMLRRLVDEHIELTLDLAPSLELVEGERAVLEEALVNLAVAAGDSLPAGGRVRITTASVEIGTSTSPGSGAALPRSGETGSAAALPRSGETGSAAALPRSGETGPATGEYVALSLTTQGWGAAAVEPDSSAVAAARRAVARFGGVLTAEAVSDESLALRVYLPQASVSILTDDSHSSAGDVAVRM